MDFITPLTIGIVGSLHCIEMYGSIVADHPHKKHNLASKISGALLYSSGRIITYSAIGIVFGMVGRGIRLAGFQQWTSILMGVALAVSVLFPYVFREKVTIADLFNRYSSSIIVNSRKIFANHNYFSMFMIGMLNGLIPCGLVFAAIAGTIISGNVLTGTFFMILFGLGTVPLLLTATFLSDASGQRIWPKMQHILPYFVFMLGILFILRGMSLGIPFVSPTSEKLAPKVMMDKGSCCK